MVKAISPCSREEIVPERNCPPKPLLDRSTRSSEFTLSKGKLCPFHEVNLLQEYHPKGGKCEGTPRIHTLAVNEHRGGLVLLWDPGENIGSIGDKTPVANFCKPVPTGTHL